jgi:heme/copper-type cytochrome/quinol oxidase subunit 2
MNVCFWFRALTADLWLTASCFAQSAAQRSDSTNIFAPASTPADLIHKLSFLVLAVTSAIFAVVFSVLVYAAVSSGEGLEIVASPRRFVVEHLLLITVAAPLILLGRTSGPTFDTVPSELEC